MKWPAFVFMISLVVALESAEARPRRQGRGTCNASKVSSTMYYLPQEGKVKNFKAAVKLQGSGIGRDGRIHTYSGKKVKRPANCKTTATSASGKCLLSYFSVAADPRYFRMGDVIHVPELAGTLVPLHGRMVEHPGFFVVHDKGGAINGPGRFDFFVGTDDPFSSKGPFNQKGLGDKRQCKYGFQKLQRGSAQARDAMAKIMGMQDSETGHGAGPALASGNGVR